MSITISIALATYNGEKYINDQLNSFAKQSLLPDELIVSDDGSKDKTLYIVKKFAQTAPFAVKIVKNFNHGIIGNFANAVENSSGDIIFFSDQDDVWFPNKLETYANTFKNNPSVGLIFSDLMVTNADLISQNKGLYSNKTKNRAKLYKSNKDLPFEDLIAVKTFVNGATMAFKSNLKKYLLPIPNTSYIHDGWTAAIASAISDTILLPDAFSFYRQHLGNAVGYKGFAFKIRLKKAVKENKLRKQDELTFLRAVSKRLEKFPNLVSRNKASFLDKKISILSEQVNLYSYNRFYRAFIILKYFLNGTYYKYFQNIKSFVTDFLAYTA